jgi:predicted alpha/beta hydrolase family esterase
MTILILHAIGGTAGDHWEQWLNNELTRIGHTVIMPNLPHAEHPDRFEWLKTIKGYLKDIDINKLVIFGHSLGVTSALDFIEQTSGNVKGLVSVSGFS